jgi:hypothetical protein
MARKRLSKKSDPPPPRRGWLSSGGLGLELTYCRPPDMLAEELDAERDEALALRKGQKKVSGTNFGSENGSVTLRPLTRWRPLVVPRRPCLE